METIDSLKKALIQRAAETTSSPRQPLSDAQYSAGFDIFLRDDGWLTYQDFIIPQLSQLLSPLFNSRNGVSVLEIGPGPRSILGDLPRCLRQKIKRYAAYEPNSLFSTEVEKWLCPPPETEPPLPYLESPLDIRPPPFVPDNDITDSACTRDSHGKFDVIISCQNIYGIDFKQTFIDRALGMLVEQPEGGMVVIFHREETLHFDGLLCHRTASFPTGAVRVANKDKALDCFARFVAGFAMQDEAADEDTRVEWRKVCRELGRTEKAHRGQDHLLFSSPSVLSAFTKSATALQELTSLMPFVDEKRLVKNREARLHPPASIIKPSQILHVQQCVQWALKHDVSLTVVGGGHSGHCQIPNVVAVDMSAFHQVHMAGGDEGDSNSHSGSLVVAGAGCTTGDIISETMAAGLTVPLGARPSVGAGLWLQGGIGHLARLYGLACDAIVGAVMVSVDSGEILCIGCVPSQHRPANAIRPKNEDDILWGIKGAGTNFGIVISVTFKAYPAPVYSIRNWVTPLSGNQMARFWLSDFEEYVAGGLPRNCSADAYLYWENDQLHLGMSVIESSTTRLPPETPMSISRIANRILGTENNSEVVDSVGLFEAEMYISEMHGGHGGGKTSSFKRCLLFKSIGERKVTNILVKAIKTRPSPLCYVHLQHGGGAICDVTANATAFGCRDWDFACVITGVWPRDKDGTAIARAAEQWVYDVAGDLLPLSNGAYGADLGPDPRDEALAAKAFGPNVARLARLKNTMDPRNVLAYACPLPKAPMEPKLIILVTGESGAGKDYCADIWASEFNSWIHKRLTARVASISDATKREYAAATGADLDRLLQDRAYKEQHRPALTAFFENQVRVRPRLRQEHFLNVVYGAADVDVLLITGLREEAPVAALSHLVPDSTLLEVRVKASEETRRARRGCDDRDGNSEGSGGKNDGGSGLTESNYQPNLIFNNNGTGYKVAAERFGEHYLLPFFDDDLQRLGKMVRSVPNYPRPAIEFRHVLGISQQPGGLALCTYLLQSHFTGDWTTIHAIVCCEAGGFVFAPALAARVNVPLALIREAGKLPPPCLSVPKPTSNISSSAPNGSNEKRIEMELHAVPRGGSMVVIDDVLATGKTLYAVLQLLSKAGIDAKDIRVMVVAEFPVLRGRELLRQCGYGEVNIQSLLVFGGA